MLSRTEVNINKVVYFLKFQTLINSEIYIDVKILINQLIDFN